MSFFAMMNLFTNYTFGKEMVNTTTMDEVIYINDLNVD